MRRFASNAAVAVVVAAVVYALITALTTLQPPLASPGKTLGTPQPAASPEPNVTAPPEEDTVLETGIPSLPVSLAVVRGGAIIDKQVVGGEVILQGSAYDYTDQMVAETDGEVVPRSMGEVACWSGGGMPGANQENTPPRPTESSAPRFTTYCYGHSWIEYAVFNLLRTLEPGTNVILQVATQTGDIYAYKLVSSFRVDKGLLGNDPRVTEDVVNRLVTVSCYRPDGYPDDLATVDNIVGIWQMIAVLDRTWSASRPSGDE